MIIYEIAFYIFALLASLHIFWVISKQEGFVNEHIFDFYVAVILGAILGSIKFGLDGGVAGGLVFGSIHIKLKNWSFKKVGDISAIPLLFVLAILSLKKTLFGPFVEIGESVLLFGMLVLGLASLVYLRNYKFFGRSSAHFRVDRFSRLSFNGGLFYIMLVYLCLLGIAFFAKGNIIRLAIYCGLLIVLVFLIIVSIKKNENAKRGVSEILKGIKDMLVTKQAKIAKQEEILKQEDMYKVPGRADDNAEFVDDAQEDISHNLTVISLEALTRARTQIRKALARIKIGKYGICEKCNKEIDPARLKAYPETTTCLKCSRKSS